MDNLTFNNMPSVNVSRAVLYDFERAFKNLRPNISSVGNLVKIEHRGKEMTVSLSQPKTSSGYTR